MAAGGLTFLVILFILIAVGLSCWIIASYSTSAAQSSGLGGAGESTEFFAWTIGNGAEIFLQFPSPVWPYTRSGNTAFVTYSARINQQTPADPNLPIIVTLPLLARSLTGGVSIYSFLLPSGDTDIEIVQFSAGSIAFRYFPSGNYATGADLITHAWSIVFWVSLVIA